MGGVDIYTVSNVLRGSGLSSSAAFEVVLGAVLNGEFNAGQFSAIKIAQISQYAENVFFGKPSGLMDQMACSVGSAITIDFKDAAAPVVDKVPFDLARYGYALCITDTKGSHADLTPDYAAVRGEMEAVAAFFGKQVLREVEEEAFYHNLPAVREKTGDRAVLRAIHFFQECRRAGRLCDAVREGRFEDFLQLITEGGHSSFEYNQNAYSTKHPEQQGVPLGLALSQRVLAGQGAREDVEELTADVFLALWAHAGELNPEQGLRPWLGTVARNRAADWLRTHKEAALCRRTPPPPAARTPRPRRSGGSGRPGLWDAVEGLDEPDRTLFLRYYYYGDKLKDIARALGLTQTAAKQRLFRGRKALRDTLTKGGVEA